MALPRIYQKLFQNEGTSTILRPDIVPACDNVSITNFNSEQSGEYTLTGDKTQAEGYPYDTSDAVYFKVINTGDEVIQYWYHDNTMLVRYKKGTDGEWSEWEQVGKDVTEQLEALANKDSELATQLQEANTALTNKDSELASQLQEVNTALSAKDTELATQITEINTSLTEQITAVAEQIVAVKYADTEKEALTAAEDNCLVLYPASDQLNPGINLYSPDITTTWDHILDNLVITRADGNIGKETITITLIDPVTYIGYWLEATPNTTDNTYLVGIADNITVNTRVDTANSYIYVDTNYTDRGFFILGEGVWEIQNTGYNNSLGTITSTVIPLIIEGGSKYYDGTPGSFTAKRDDGLTAVWPVAIKILNSDDTVFSTGELTPVEGTSEYDTSGITIPTEIGSYKFDLGGVGADEGYDLTWTHWLEIKDPYITRTMSENGIEAGNTGALTIDDCMPGSTIVLTGNFDADSASSADSETTKSVSNAVATYAGSYMFYLSNAVIDNYSATGDLPVTFSNATDEILDIEVTKSTTSATFRIEAHISDSITDAPCSFKCTIVRNHYSPEISNIQITYKQYHD